MSIDARVRAVIDKEDGSGKLLLEGRKSGESPGQSELNYETAPYENTSLNGLEVWGNASELILGDRKIADRIGYTKIRFVDDESFREAVVAYRQAARG